MVKLYHFLIVVAVTLFFNTASCASSDTWSSYNPTNTEDLSFNITNNETITDFMISVSPSSSVYIYMYDSKTVNVTYMIFCESTDTIYSLRVHIPEDEIAFVTTTSTFNVSCRDNENTFRSPHPFKDGTLVTGTLNITLTGEQIGRAWLMFETDSTNTTKIEEPDDTGNSDGINGRMQLYKHLVVVIRKARPIDTIFRVVVYFFLVISTIGMGCKMEIDVVISVLKKPVAPAIGFCSQYILMPMIAFAVAKLIKFQNPAVGLGIFASGICPGGGASNIYSYLLGGDVSLSVTMTTISNIGALGMIPLWIFTLGQQFQDDKIQITIPYLDIIQTLALVILPLFVGILIKYKCVKVAKIIMKVLKPVTFVTIAVVLTFGIYANLYIFRLFKPTTFLAGCLLPYAGYILGGLAGLIFRQPWYRVKTIAIETGVQNTIVAYIMLLTALPPPDGDLAAVGPVASAVMTPIPLFIIALIYNIYLKCTHQDYDMVSRSDREKNEEAVQNGTENEKNGSKRNKKKDKKIKKDEHLNKKAKDDVDEAEIELVGK